MIKLKVLSSIGRANLVSVLAEAGYTISIEEVKTGPLSKDYFVNIHTDEDSELTFYKSLCKSQSEVLMNLHATITDVENRDFDPVSENGISILTRSIEIPRICLRMRGDKERMLKMLEEVAWREYENA